MCSRLWVITCHSSGVEKMRSSCCSAAIFLLSIAAAFSVCGGNFYNDFVITWGDGRAKIADSGNLLTLSLDKTSGSAFQSKNTYLFGKIDMQIKLVPGNSAGTVTTYYMMGGDSERRDEIDMEFLGNLSGDPYTLHTNIYTQGKGGREQQFRLWFDPTSDFHTYSILWNPLHILISVDGTPVREFLNLESNGIPYPRSQPMRIHSSIWNADEWATRGGLIKTDWSKAPFVASYRNFRAEVCVWSSSGKSSCSNSSSAPPWFWQRLDSASFARLKWVEKNHMIYNYCTDAKRFPRGFPRECYLKG